MIHGKCSLKVLQLHLVLSVVAAWWFMVFYGNIHVPLSIITDFDNSLAGDTWATLFAILGAVSIVVLGITFKKGQRKEDAPKTSE